MEPFTILGVFLLGVVSSFVGSMVGGSSLIAIPFLIFAGLPPQTAIATIKLGAIGSSVSATYKFWKGKKIIFKYVLPLSVAAVAGSYIGANILLQIDKQILSTLIGAAMLLILPVIFFKKKIGVEKVEASPGRKYVGYFLYFIVAVWGGFFSAGWGAMALYIFMSVFGMTIVEGSATGMIPWFLASVMSLSVFAMNGIVDYSYGVVLLLGMFLGGYLGAHTAIKKGDKWVKIIFALMIIGSAIKLLFF